VIIFFYDTSGMKTFCFFNLKNGFAELASGCVQAVQALSEVPEGLIAIKENSNSIRVLKRFVNSVPRIGGTEDALHAAKRLIKQACDQ